MSNGEGYKDPTADQAIHNVTKAPWRDMTEADIWCIKKEKCQYCMYANKAGSTGESLTALHCDYIGKVGHRRGCRPDECDKFVPRKRKRKGRAMRVKKGSKTDG